MASSVIHMCVAKEINKVLNYPENELLLGSIAPDISKHIGENKNRSHFLDKDNDDDSMNIDAFLNKYKEKIKEPFMMGYFIHLYTDLLWNKYFVSEIVEKGTIKLLNGEKIDIDPVIYKKLIYNDYTNLNIKLIDEYNLDLSLFYNEVIVPDIHMDEIPVEKLHLLVDQAGIIIQNTKENKAYTFDIENIKTFIDLSVKLIISVINEL